jgi:hypothetical protein
MGYGLCLIHNAHSQDYTRNKGSQASAWLPFLVSEQVGGFTRMLWHSVVVRGVPS